MTRRRFRRTTGLTFRAASALLLLGAPAVCALSGCGGSMASSSAGWQLSSVIAYGNPTVEIQPVEGATTTGSFDITDASPISRVGEPIFVVASFTVNVPGVNTELFGGPGAPIGTLSTVWEDVSSNGAPSGRVAFNSPSGQTFTGYQPSNNRDVRVTGESGVFITVNEPGPVTLRIRATLHYADGSTDQQDFTTTLNIVPALGAAAQQ